MLPTLLVLLICVVVWDTVKTAAVNLEKPWLWDYAEVSAGVVATIGAAYIQYPQMYAVAGLRTSDPLLSLLWRSLTWGVGIIIITLTLSIFAEQDNMMETPDGLAPVEARVFEGVNTVDELDGETLEKYQ